MSRRRRKVLVHAASWPAWTGARAGVTRTVVVALMGCSLDGDCDGIGHWVRLCWADFYRRRGRYGYELTYTLGVIVGGAVSRSFLCCSPLSIGAWALRSENRETAGAGEEDHRLHGYG